MADSDNYRTVLPAGSITATGASGAIHVTSNTTAAGVDVVINLTGFTGGTAPSITFSVAWDADADSATYPPATWGTPTSTAALTAGGRTVLHLAPTVGPKGTVPCYIKVSWTVTGAPTSVNHTGIFVS